MKRKKVILILMVFVFCVLFFPIRKVYEDKVEYKAILYSVIKYQNGIEVKFFQHVFFQNIVEDFKEPDEIKTDKRIIKVNGELYFEMDSKQGDNWNSCGTYHGKIQSHVREFEIPNNDDEANFEGDYEYQIVSENVIKICPNDTTIYFMKKIDSNSTFDSVSDGEIDVNSDFVQRLYHQVNPSDDASILKGIYEGESGFSNDYILSVGIVNLIKEKFYRNEEYIRAEDVEQMIHKILGFQVSFVHQDTRVFGFDSFGVGICGYTYLPESHQYQLMHGCGGNWFEFFDREVVSAVKNEDYVFITEKSIYWYNDWDDQISKRYIYNNSNREKLLDYIVKDSNEFYQVKLADYMKDASTYVYVFKKQNGEYILESVKKDS